MGFLDAIRHARKRPLKAHELFNPEVHRNRRGGNERRLPWQRADQNDRRGGADRRKESQRGKAAHVFWVKH